MWNMLRGRQWMAAMALVGAGLVMPASAQFGGGGQGGGGGGGGGGGFQIDPTQIRQQILGQVQQQVGFTDEEWAAIGPKLWNVLALQVDSGTGAIGGMVGGLRGRGGAGGRGGPGGAGGISGIISQIFNNGQPSVVATKTQELQDAVTNPDSTPAQLRTKLEEYRAAVAKVRVQLAAAQADLEGLLTLRQEAVLMSLGFLD